jgi:hypothetical protein
MVVPNLDILVVSGQSFIIFFSPQESLCGSRKLTGFPECIHRQVPVLLLRDVSEDIESEIAPLHNSHAHCS